jgi:hypothetical protein
MAVGIPTKGVTVIKAVEEYADEQMPLLTKALK